MTGVQTCALPICINLISNDYERETAKLRTEHRRQIEDLRDKLRTEKNLNKTAREAINRQINMLDTAFQRAQLQLIQKHNQEEEAANNERTQRRIEEWNKSAEAIEDAQQRAILIQQMNDAKSQVMNVQRQYNDYIDKLAHDGVEKYSDEQQQQIDTN